MSRWKLDELPVKGKNPFSNGGHWKSLKGCLDNKLQRQIVKNNRKNDRSKLQSLFAWFMTLINIVKLLNGLMERLKKLETPSEENVPEKPKEKDVLNRSVFPKKGLTVRLMKDSSDKDLVTIHLSIPAWKDTLQDFDVNFPYTGFVKSLNFERLRVVNHVTPVHSDIDKFVKAIFKTNCISGIRADSPFKIKMYKSGALSWDEVTPKLYEALESVFPDLEKPESQQPVTNELEEATAP